MSLDPAAIATLFTDARTNPVLVERRSAAQDLLREMVIAEEGRRRPGAGRVSGLVGAAMYAGAMAELAHRWLIGSLGVDLDAVVDHALALVLRDG